LLPSPAAKVVGHKLQQLNEMGLMGVESRGGVGVIKLTAPGLEFYLTTSMVFITGHHSEEPVSTMYNTV
jgi:hypothetical protein